MSLSGMMMISSVSGSSSSSPAVQSAWPVFERVTPRVMRYRFCCPLISLSTSQSAPTAFSTQPSSPSVQHCARHAVRASDGEHLYKHSLARGRRAHAPFSSPSPSPLAYLYMFAPPCSHSPALHIRTTTTSAVPLDFHHLSCFCKL